MAEARLAAVDLSPAALAVAAANARQLGARVAFAAGDLASALRLDRFDLVISNPPYVDPRDEGELSPEITGFEPALALYAEGGSSIFARLLAAAAQLPAAAFLLFEIGRGQLAAVEALAGRSGFDVVEVRADLADIPRGVLLQRRHG